MNLINKHIDFLNTLPNFSPCFITLYLDTKIELSTIYIKKSEIINISRKDIEFIFYHGKHKFYSLTKSFILENSTRILLEDKFEYDKFNN